MEINLLIFLIAILTLLSIILMINFITIVVIYKRTNEFYEMLYEQAKVFKQFVIFVKEKFKGFEIIEENIANVNQTTDRKTEEVHKHLYELEEKYLKDKNYSTKTDMEYIKNIIIANTRLLNNAIVDNADAISVRIKENQPYLVGIKMPKSFSDAFDDILKKSSTKEKK